jgi:porin-like protein
MNRMARLRILRIIAAMIGSAIAVHSVASAQTLVEPNSKPNLSKSSGLAKSQPTLRTKSCSSFGAGFAQIPGTDTCVKIGGYVTIESTVNHGR